MRDGATTRVPVEIPTRLIVTTRTRSRWVGVRVQLVHEMTIPNMSRGTATMTCEGSSAVAIRAIAAMDSTHATCSCGTSTLPRGADREIVHDARDREYTLGVRKAARSQPSGRFGLSQHAISATTTSVRPIRAQATCDISARQGSSEPSGWMVIGMSPSSSRKRAATCWSRTAATTRLTIARTVVRSSTRA
jgi:hypothetical protein